MHQQPKPTTAIRLENLIASLNTAKARASMALDWINHAIGEAADILEAIRDEQETPQRVDTTNGK